MGREADFTRESAMVMNEMTDSRIAEGRLFKMHQALDNKVKLGGSKRSSIPVTGFPQLMLSPTSGAQRGGGCSVRIFCILI
uniref:Uncharacterized protein n=1 Tax=Ditylenchus dipsaci TaxID=166011 RepID=A0A915EC17_9BILA